MTSTAARRWPVWPLPLAAVAVALAAGQGLAPAALAGLTLWGLGRAALAATRAVPPALLAQGAATAGLGAAAADLPLEILSAVAALAGALHLVAYVRLRRRGLMGADRAAPALLALLAAQALLAAGGLPAAPVAGAAMAAMWRLSRPVLPARDHRRLWLGAALLVAGAALARTL